MRCAFFTFTTLLLSLVFMGCTQSANNAFTPTPEELITAPEYREQISDIDQLRVKGDLETFSYLIEKNRVTREDNGTEPIVIEVERIRPEDGEELLDDNGEALIDPIHDKAEVEEYFILEVTPNEEGTDKKDPEKADVEEPVDLKASDDKVVLTDEEDITINLDGPESTIPVKISEEETSEVVLSPEPEAPAGKSLQEVDLTPTPNVKDQTDEHTKPPVVTLDDEKDPEVLHEDIADSKSKGAPLKAPAPKARPSTDAAFDSDDEAMDEVDGETAGEDVFVPTADTMRADWDERKDGPLFTKITIEALEKHGENLLNTDLEMKSGGYKRYCSRYNLLTRNERKQFWLMFISGLSRMESGFRPSVKYKESFKHKGKYVYSRGLLQMSIGSVNQRAYSCNVERAQDLHKPEVNLTCAVKIMNHWIKKDRAIYGLQQVKGGEKDWLGVANYWAPIRLEKYSGKKRKKHERLGKLINDMGMCNGEGVDLVDAGVGV